MQQQTKKQVDSSYDKMPKAIRRSTELNATQKLLYAYMLDRFMYFSSLKKEFYEAGETLAQEIGVTRKTVQNSLDVLLEKGLVVKKTRKKKGVLLECVYEVLDIHSVYS